MQQIKGRITLIVWWGPSLTLSSAFAWKNRIGVVRLVNPSKAGFVSFALSRQANSLTVIPTTTDPSNPVVIQLEATGVTTDPATWFTVDNGPPPMGSTLVEPDTFTFEATATDPLVAFLHEHHSLPGSTSLTNLQTLAGAGTLAFSLNGGPYQDMTQTSAALLALPVASQNRLRPRLTRTTNTLTRLQLTTTYAS